MRVALLALTLLACTPAQDPRAFIEYQASFLRPGVDIATEEGEVERVLGQRGLRVTSRVAQQGFVALGASSRDRRLSAVRVITGRGTVVAEDADADDLFQPEHLELLESFGGTVGEYSLVAYARVPVGREVGCVTMQRLLPDASALACVLDVSDLGARACVSSVSPGRGGRVRAKIAWPSLHAYSTPQLDVELAFDDKPDTMAPIVRLAPGPWLDQETTRYNAVVLTRADFSQRHAVGLVRAVLAKLAGKSLSSQIDVYRNAIGTILPASLEAQLASETLRHIQTGWLDAPEPPAPASRPRPAEAENPPEPIEPAQPLPEDSMLVEPAPETR
jgi:hypothetical protein